MSAAAEGGNGPGPGSGPSNPRKFSEKIALHNQRQAEETAAFQEVMMDISSTRVRSRRECGWVGRRRERQSVREDRPLLGVR
ncbi:UNVERIFIED_CONTAM: hypothetical protein FKN15_022443 [Acipenser sinensis]